MTKTEEPYNFCDNIEKDNLMLAAESSWRGIISSTLLFAAFNAVIVSITL